MKKLAIVLCLMCLASCNEVIPRAHAHGTVDAGMPCAFSNGQVLTAACLNANFNHLHDTFAGGIVDSHVSASAAVQHSKLATPALIPKAWALVSTACNCGAADGTACTILESSMVTAVKATGATGVCKVELGYLPQNSAFGVSVTPYGAGMVAWTSNLSTSAPHFKVNFTDHAGTSQNSAFFFTVFDREN